VDAPVPVRAAEEVRLLGDERLRPVVEEKLELRWSPQQISGWLRESFPDRAEMQVSHETIYMSLFVQSRGALRKELTHELRRGHATRRPRSYSTYNGQGRLRGGLHISQRVVEHACVLVEIHEGGRVMQRVGGGVGRRDVAPDVGRARRQARRIEQPSSGERETLAGASGAEPVLLLDDVFAELDRGRQQRLAVRLLAGGARQTFITSPREDELPDGFHLETLSVEDGRVGLGMMA